jgi:hypothetical protein
MIVNGLYHSCITDHYSLALIHTVLAGADKG